MWFNYAAYMDIISFQPSLQRCPIVVVAAATLDAVVLFTQETRNSEKGTEHRGKMLYKRKT